MEYFSKKYTHLKSKIIHKFHRLLFVFFYSFSIVVIFFSYFIYPNLSKTCRHFCGALLYGLLILSENSEKFLNVYQKIQRYFKYKTFSEFHRLLLAFLIFQCFLHLFFFLFYLSMVFKKIVKLLCCFIVWIRDCIKKLRYLKSKISTKFHRLLFTFYFFSIFGILFSISPTQICPKIIEFFVVFYWKGQSFY